jgi:hypothetical protein
VRLLSGAWLAIALTVGGPAAAAPSIKRACVDAYEHAQELRRDGQLRASREHLVVCAQSRCPDLARQDCLKWLREVDDAIPTIIVTARDASDQDLADVQVSVDGSVVLDHLDGKPIAIDPGAHTIRLEYRGQTIEQPVIIAAGEKNRNLSASFPGPSAPKAPAPAAAPAAPPRSAPPSAPAHTPAAIPPATLLLGATGIVLAGLSAYFEVKGITDRQNLFDVCAGRCPQAEVDFAYRELRAGDILGAVAIASLGGALWFYLARPRSSVPSSPSVGIDVRAASGGGGLEVRGRF